MSRRRARNGTRWIDGKLFTFVYASRDKAQVREIAAKVREGEYPCGHAQSGCGGPHYARVVKQNWHDMTVEVEDGEDLDLNCYAVFAFPKD